MVSLSLTTYVARPYTTFDARVAYAFTSGGRKWEASLNGINLGKRHQEIADASQQVHYGYFFRLRNRRFISVVFLCHFRRVLTLSDAELGMAGFMLRCYPS